MYKSANGHHGTKLGGHIYPEDIQAIYLIKNNFIIKKAYLLCFTIPEKAPCLDCLPEWELTGRLYHPFVKVLNGCGKSIQNIPTLSEYNSVFRYLR